MRFVVDRLGIDHRGDRVLSRSGRFAAVSDDTAHITLWDVLARKQLSVAAADDIRSLYALSDDGDLLAMEDSKGLRLHELRQSRVRCTIVLEDPWDVVLSDGSVAFSPDGRWLAAPVAENRYAIWQTNDCRLHAAPDIDHEGQIFELAFNPAGSLIEGA